jgi:hypothetical protein
LRENCTSRLSERAEAGRTLHLSRLYSWEADEQSGPDRSGAGGAKGNASQQSTRRTQSRVSVSHALERIRQAVTKNALPSHTQGGSRMPELGSYGSVRGALSNERPYRDLRNVVANYPFESSRGFPGSEPNSGHGDHSRLSCSAGDKQLGAGFCRDLQQAFYTDVGHHAASPRRHELAAISFDQKMIRGKASNTICSVCAGLSAQRERVW